MERSTFLPSLMGKEWFHESKSQRKRTSGQLPLFASNRGSHEIKDAQKFCGDRRKRMGRLGHRRSYDPGKDHFRKLAENRWHPIIRQMRPGSPIGEYWGSLHSSIQRSSQAGARVWQKEHTSASPQAPGMSDGKGIEDQLTPTHAHDPSRKHSVFQWTQLTSCFLPHSHEGRFLACKI